MPSIDELLSNAKTELNTALVQGLNDIRRNQQITFTKYVRVILPLDGYVFWINASLLATDSSLWGNASAADIAAPNTVTLPGYLHLTSEVIQEDAQLYDKNAVTFTTQSDIDPFNDVGTDILYIAEFYGIRFAFSRRDGLNKSANIFHYTGNAVYPHMLTQIIDNASDIDLSDVIVSNSLPVWLTLNQYFPVYPAMLVQANTEPPYAAVKCSKPEAIAGAIYTDINSNSYQLVRETVTVTVTGVRNAAIMDWRNYVDAYTLSDSAEMGIMNCPVIADIHVNQPEINALAIRKTITFEVNYYQERMLNVARNLILSAIPTLYLEP